MDALVGFLVDIVALRHLLGPSRFTFVLDLPGRIIKDVLLHAQATREFEPRREYVRVEPPVQQRSRTHHVPRATHRR
jgi:hypothetical protein